MLAAIAVLLAPFLAERQPPRQFSLRLGAGSQVLLSVDVRL
jgi:hypothetical protein